MKSIVALGILVAGSISATWHPGHESYAEVERNRKTGNLQVALCVWPEDLERALRQFSSSRVSLDDPHADELIAAYLKKKWRVRKGDASAALALRWVGKEVDAKKAWLYFEVLGVGDGSDLVLENRLLLNEVDQQQNYVTFVDDGKRVSMMFDQAHPVFDLTAGVAVDRLRRRGE